MTYPESEEATWRYHVTLAGLVTDGPYGGEFTENIVLMLSTGLKDKNGREIFEGDILRYKKHRYLPDIITQAVEWSEASAGFDLFASDSEYGAECDEHEAEIIGNIYENPELPPYLVEKEPEHPKPHVPEINLPRQGLY